MRRIYFNLYLSNKKNNNWNWHRECYNFNQMIVRRILKNPFYIFFRFFNLQTQSADAQFYSSSKWLKKVQVCFYMCNLHTKQHLKPYTCICGFYRLATILVSFGQKQACSKNIYISILKLKDGRIFPKNQLLAARFSPFEASYGQKSW